MIATSQDVLVPDRATWDRLPEGLWEVVEGRAILLPPARVAHQLFFEEGRPPELAIEILSTRRGSVERSEKMEDYARAGIAEYWIVNPVDREVEVYHLQAGEYVLVETANTLKPLAFPEVEVDMSAVWSVLD